MKKKFKIRASAIHNIMGALKNQITPAQTKLMYELIDKKAKYILEGKAIKSKELLEKLPELEKLYAHKPTYEDLPEGAIKYAENWCKKELYGKSEIYLQNKYTDKGITVEDENIKYLDPSYENNKEQFDNEWILGEPDVIIKAKKTIRDLKSSWDFITFLHYMRKNYPMKITNDKAWGYMDMLKYKKYFVD